MLHCDRHEVSNVSFKSAATSVNPGPKRIGYFGDRMPYQHWKNENYCGIMLLMNNMKKFIETFDSRMSEQIQNQLVSAIGVGEQILYQAPSRMPGIATGDLINAEPSHMILSGMTQRINDFLIKMVQRNSKTRFHILAMSYNQTFQGSQYCKYIDFVSLPAGKYAKSAWKFYRHYHLCLNLRLILDRFASRFDKKLIFLNQSVDHLLSMISYLWRPTFGNHLRDLSEDLFNAFMKTWQNSSCNPNEVYDDNGTQVLNKKKNNSQT